MPRKFLKRVLPDPQSLQSRRELRFLGRLLDDPFLLHLNRRSVSGACALGLFVAFLPIPGQMPLAAGIAVLLRVNLMLSVMMVWVTNPITMPPIFYFCYRLGAWLLRVPARGAVFEPTLEWFWFELGVIWQPLLLGCLVLGSLAAATAYASVQLLWRLGVVLAVRRRRRRPRRQASER